jgi:phosphate transport system protein
VKHFTRAIELLQEQITRQEDLVSRCVEDAIYAFLTHDEDRARRTVAIDTEVDRAEVRIEEECLKLIALHQPVARDLRYLATALKVNNDLERIADHASNVARAALSMMKDRTFEFPPETAEMAARVTEALTKGIRALRRADAMEAREVLERDPQVDLLDSSIRNSVKEMLRAGTEHLDAALLLYRAGREMERIADLATNIAEDTIYLVTGEIIRHRRPAEWALDTRRQTGA